MELSFNLILQSLLTEGRAKNIIDKWSNYVIPGREDRGPMKNEDEWNDVIRRLQESDPSNNQKYLDYMLSQVVSNWANELSRIEDDDMVSLHSWSSEIIELINKFHNYTERNLIKDKDIYNPNYKDLTVLADTIFQADLKAKELAKERELKGGVDRLYEDSRWKLLVPKTHQASCHYGAGTKWCTTSKDTDSYFKTYTTNAVLFYILDKTRKEGSLYKLAINRQFTPGKEVCDYLQGTGKYCYTKLGPMSSWGTGYDEQDRPVNLEHVISLLPKGLQVAMDNYYQITLDRINESRKQEAITKVQTNWKSEEDLRKLYSSRVKQLETALFDAVSGTEWVQTYMDGIEFGEVVENSKFKEVYGTWEYMSMDNGHRFQISTNNEQQAGYFIDGQLIVDENNLATIRLYKTKEGGRFGIVEDAEAINVNLPISTNRLLWNKEYRSVFASLVIAGLERNLERRFVFNSGPSTPEASKITSISQEQWESVVTPRTTIDFGWETMDDQFTHVLISVIKEVIEYSLYAYFFQSGVPSKDGSVLWSSKNSHSTYKFEYPAAESSMTKRFLDYIIANPGKTAEEFYIDVLGRRRPPANNSSFFSAISDAGLARSVRNGRKFGYFIGPNYQTWAEGKLKRI